MFFSDIHRSKGKQVKETPFIQVRSQNNYKLHGNIIFITVHLQEECIMYVPTSLWLSMFHKLETKSKNFHVQGLYTSSTQDNPIKDLSTQKKKHMSRTLDIGSFADCVRPFFNAQRYSFDSIFPLKQPHLCTTEIEPIKLTQSELRTTTEKTYEEN